jgi:hypothetical protein
MLLRIPVAAAALAVVALLSGCGSNSATPVFTSSAPTTTPVVESTAPPKRESPEHFIRRFEAAYQAMQSSGNTAAYSAMYSSACQNCRSNAAQVAKIYKAGGSISPGGSSVIEIKNVAGDRFNVRVSYGPTNYASMC